jgi:STE24 endopeptidase
VAVPDEEDASLRGRKRGERGKRSEDVLPDRVPGACVVQRHVVLHRLRLEGLEEPAWLVLQNGRSPAGTCGRVHSEVVEVEPTEDAEVVVSYQADIGAFRDERAAAIRTRSVAHQIAEAPDGVGRVVGDRIQDSIQRMQISVNVRDDGDAHRSRATLAKRGAFLLAAVVWIVSGALLWRTEVPSLQLAELNPRSFFAGEQLARIADYRRVTRALFLASFVVQGAVLAVFAWKAAGLAEAVSGFFRGRILTGVALGALVAVAVWLALLPLSGVSHWWRRRYGLSHQGYDGWLRDQAVSLAVQVVLVTLAVAAFMALATWVGRSWWLAGGPALALAGTVFLAAYPLVVQPLFNSSEPLPDRELAAKIEVLAREEGVTVKSVEVTDASRQTTAANAYVAGIGPTRRVVLFDTLLDGRFTQPEILSVSAHELAHVGRRHLWKGLGWFALIVIPCVAILARVTERGGGLAEPATVLLALALAFALFVVTLPLSNVVSRRYEAEADWIALRTTDDPASFVQLERKLVLSALADPAPPGWFSFAFATHPSAMKRIAMAEAFKYRSRAGS